MDASAMTVSGLCLIHCLLLPLAALSLPVAGVLAEAEWVHKAFVAAALPISGFAIARSWNRPSAAGFAWLALTGLALLCAGAFVGPLHDHETALTVLGAVILAGAHLRRWASHARS